MNRIERFKAVVNREHPDYTPIFGMHGAPGFSYLPSNIETKKRLLATGLPDYVLASQARWEQYWGVEMPMRLELSIAEPAPGIKSVTRVENGYEIIEYETGAVTRQVIDNDYIYTMPEFKSYHVRDRESWEKYKGLATPGPIWSMDKIHDAIKPYKRRDRPLSIPVGTTWGGLRSLMGPELACAILYDDPALAMDIIDWQRQMMRKYRFPLVELLKPEIIATGEDMCYNHGPFIGPDHFEKISAPTYRELADLAKANDVDLVAVDCDGNVTKLVDWLSACGVNCLFPCEVKAGNDLYQMREDHPDFVFIGWLEKEILNEGNEDMIEKEVFGKVPALIRKGGYFPNGDHGFQPLLNYPNLRKAMTLLHEVTNNPLGEFPRTR